MDDAYIAPFSEPRLIASATTIMESYSYLATLFAGSRLYRSWYAATNGSVWLPGTRFERAEIVHTENCERLSAAFCSRGVHKRGLCQYHLTPESRLDKVHKYHIWLVLYTAERVAILYMDDDYGRSLLDHIEDSPDTRAVTITTTEPIASPNERFIQYCSLCIFTSLSHDWIWIALQNEYFTSESSSSLALSIFQVILPIMFSLFTSMFPVETTFVWWLKWCNRRGRRGRRDCFSLNNYSFDWNDVIPEGSGVHRVSDTGFPALRFSAVGILK